MGLLIAVGVSFLLILARASRPRWAILGRTKDAGSDDIAYQSLEAHPEGKTVPGLLIFRFDADLFFANANVFADDVREAISASKTKPQVVLLDAESISDIDSTAVGVMRDLIAELRAEGIEVWAARIKTRVSEMLGRLGVLANAPIYPSVTLAVAAFERDGPRGLADTDAADADHDEAKRRRWQRAQPDDGQNTDQVED